MAAARLLFFLLASTAALAAEPWEAFFDPFLGDLRSELAEAKAAKKTGLLIMYHFEECPYCARMKREVLSRPEVQSAFHRDYVVIALDTRGSQSVTGLDGKALPENQLARELGVQATPSFDFYGLDGAQLYRHVGGIFDADEFLLLGRYVASGEHRSLTFAEFKQKYKGS
jgi:thioredoxin-related protein